MTYTRGLPIPKVIRATRQQVNIYTLPFFVALAEGKAENDDFLCHDASVVGLSWGSLGDLLGGSLGGSLLVGLSWWVSLGALLGLSWGSLGVSWDALGAKGVTMMMVTMVPGALLGLCPRLVPLAAPSWAKPCPFGLPMLVPFFGG